MASDFNWNLINTNSNKTDPLIMVSVFENMPPSFRACLRCHMCKRYPVTPPNGMIFLCEDEHFCCQYCAHSQHFKRYGCTKLVDDGKVCKKRIQVKPGPSNLLAFYSNAVFFCHNSFKGCSTKVRGSEYNNHVQNCDFRFSVACFDTGCSRRKSFNYSTLWDHIRNFHEDGEDFRNNLYWSCYGTAVPVNVSQWEEKERYILASFTEGGQRFVVVAEAKGDGLYVFGFCLNWRRQLVDSFQLHVKILRAKFLRRSALTCKILEFGKNVTSEQLEELAGDNMAVRLSLIFLEEKEETCSGEKIASLLELKIKKI